MRFTNQATLTILIWSSFVITKSIVKRTEGASAAFIKELMRRAAQYHLQNGNQDELAAEDINLALEDMLFTGGTLNVKLLGEHSQRQRR